MKVISLINEKGGVAKTTCAVHIAAGLALLGQKVVLVDADPQGHAGMLLDVPKEAGFYDLVVRRAAWKQVLRQVPLEVYENPLLEADPNGLLFVCPSNVETRNIANSISDSFAVARRFGELAKAGIDAVIVDTSPTPSLLHGAIYLATDSVLYPTKPEALSFDGLMESLSHREEADEVRSQKNIPQINIGGIIPTMYRKGVSEHRDNLAELKDTYGDMVWKPMTFSTIYAEGTRIHRPVWTFAPKEAAAADAWQLVQQVARLTQHV